MDETRDKLNAMKAGVFKALGHPVRMAVVDALRDGPRCVCELATDVGAERSNLSRHLSVMARAGVLKSQKRGQMVYYALATPCVLGFLGCLETMLRERLSGERELLEVLGT